MRRTTAVLLLLLGLSGVSGVAWATEDNVRKAFENAACAAPPCTGSAGFVPSGPKTVSVEIDGTGTVETRCKYVTATNSRYEVFDTLTGTNTFSGFAMLEGCGDLTFIVTACTACTVRASVQSENGF